MQRTNAALAESEPKRTNTQRVSQSTRTLSKPALQLKGRRRASHQPRVKERRRFSEGAPHGPHSNPDLLKSTS